jgi:hypothetical protein
MLGMYRGGRLLWRSQINCHLSLITPPFIGRVSRTKKRLGYDRCIPQIEK